MVVIIVVSLLPDPGETLPSFRQNMPPFGGKIPLSNFWVKIRMKNAFLCIFFNLSHVLFRKIVFLLNKWKKSLIFYLQKLEKIIFRYFADTFVSNWYPLSNSSTINYFFLRYFEQNSGIFRYLALAKMLFMFLDAASVRDYLEMNAWYQHE